jgi:cytochrome c-type biogenesis protein
MVGVSVPAAAAAGVVSFLSPCVLPLVPGYLAFISASPDIGPDGAPQVPVSQLAYRAVAFIGGFSLVFILLGASATQLGQLVNAQGPLFARLAGLLIIIFGLHMMGVVRIPILYREKRFSSSTPPRSFGGAAAVGAAFAFGWTPCIGPILGGILALAAVQNSMWEGVRLLSAYSVGLGLPFLVAALFAGYLMRFLLRFRRFYRGVEIAGGALLMGVGLLIMTGRLTWLAGQFSWLQRFAL